MLENSLPSGGVEGLSYRLPANTTPCTVKALLMAGINFSVHPHPRLTFIFMNPFEAINNLLNVDFRDK